MTGIALRGGARQDRELGWHLWQFEILQTPAPATPSRTVHKQHCGGWGGFRKDYAMQVRLRWAEQESWRGAAGPLR
jgi:hypothetical protein